MMKQIRNITTICTIGLMVACTPIKYVRTETNTKKTNTTHTTTTNTNKEKEDKPDKSRSYYSDKLGIEIGKIYNEALLKEVIGWLGVPYVYGAEDKSGTDCAGFVMMVYKAVYGIDTPRSSSGIYEASVKVNRDELKQGDLVFFKIKTPKVGHVGIFLQDSYFIHASSSKGVMVSDLNLEYWTKYFVSGGRLK